MDQKEIRENFAIFSQSEKVWLHARKAASFLLESLGDVEIEASEAVSVATVTILKKLDAGEIKIPDDLKSPEAFWMAHFKQHIKHYLLKRYARRSNRKPADVYRKEMKELKEMGVKDSKPLKYQGPRFESTVEEMLMAGANSTPETIHLQSDEQLRSSLGNTGLKPEIIDLIMMRAEGLTFEEMGARVRKSEDAVRQQYNRHVVDADLNRDLVSS